MARDKHGIPDPLTLRVRSGVIVVAGAIVGVFQYSPCIDRGPRGWGIQWEPVPPMTDDPKPDDGKEYLRCNHYLHDRVWNDELGAQVEDSTISRWVLKEEMVREGRNRNGYRSVCLACMREEAALRRRGMRKR